MGMTKQLVAACFMSNVLTKILSGTELQAYTMQVKDMNANVSGVTDLTSKWSFKKSAADFVAKMFSRVFSLFLFH